jgi:SAM-dependent methyltransferase
MNLAHNVLCSSGLWRRRVERKLVPWGLEDLELGDDVLELGPGFGATTRLLGQALPGRLTALELDERYCARLRRELADRATVVQGDARSLPFVQGRFSAVVCFTMLHHIPGTSQQDRAFAEIARVIRPGGTIAGTDSIGAGRLFRLIHIGDDLTLVDPDSVPQRLAAVGFERTEVQRAGDSFRFRARKPA